MDTTYIVLALRIILGLLYILASVFKFPDIKGFATSIASFGLVPKRLIKPIAYFHPVIELGVGLAILFNIYLREAAFLGLIFIIIADIFVGYGYFKKKIKDCGCYGIAIKVPVTKYKLLENAIWTILFLALFILSL
jgi:putative oxidoreductase